MKNLMKTKCKAVFFDWDNTIVDTWPILLQASNIVREHFGFPKTNLEDLKISARRSSRESFPEVFGENWQKSYDIFYGAIQDNKALLKPYEGTIDLVNSLRDMGYIIAVISNKKRELLQQEIDQFQLDYDLVLGSGDSAYDKPHPELGEIALKHFGITAAEAIYVGDSPTDWVFAKNLGMPAIAIGDDAYEGELLARLAKLDETIKKYLTGE